MQNDLGWLRVLLTELPEKTDLPQRSAAESLYNTQKFYQRLSSRSLTGGNPPSATPSKDHFIQELWSLMEMEMGYGDPVFKERGAGIAGIVDILQEAFVRFPGDGALNEFVSELQETVKGYYWDVGVQVRVNLSAAPELQLLKNC